MIPTVLTTLLWTISLFTVCGNLLVLISYRRDQRLREVHNFYIIHLAACDLLIGAILIPLLITVDTWNFHRLSCLAVRILYETMMAMGAFLVLLIGVDRLTLLKLGARYNIVETFTRAGVRIWGCLGALVLIHVLCMFTDELLSHNSLEEEEECDINCNHKFAITLTLFLMDFVVPFIGLCVVHVLLFLAIRKRLQTRVRAASFALEDARSSTKLLAGRTRKKYKSTKVLIVKTPVTIADSELVDSKYQNPSGQTSFFSKATVCSCGACKPREQPAVVPDYLSTAAAYVSPKTPEASAPVVQAENLSLATGTTPSSEPTSWQLDGSPLSSSPRNGQVQVPAQLGRMSESFPGIGEGSVEECQSFRSAGRTSPRLLTLPATSAEQPQSEALTPVEFPSGDDEDAQPREKSITSQKRVSCHSQLPNSLNVESTPALVTDVRETRPSPSQHEGQGQGFVTALGYGSIITVRRSSILQFQAQRIQQMHQQQQRRQAVQSKETRVARILFGLALVLLVCWLPVEILSLASSWRWISVSDEYFYFALGALWLKSSVNPLLYAANSPTFRRNFAELLSPLCRCFGCCERSLSLLRKASGNRSS